MSTARDWDVCYACNGAGYFDGGDMRDDETCHTCSGRGNHRRTDPGGERLMTWTPTDEQARELGRVMEREMGSFLAHDPAFPDYFWTNQARAVLAAAGPMIAAQVWDEAVDAITYPAIDEGRSRMTLRLVLPLPENPYTEKGAGR